MFQVKTDYLLRVVITAFGGIFIFFGGLVMSFLNGEFHLEVAATTLALTALAFVVSYLNYLVYRNEQRKDDRIQQLQYELDELKRKQQ